MRKPLALFVVLVFGLALVACQKEAPAPQKPAEPAKAEPAKAEPAATEPAKAEPAKAEPAKAEPAKAEPAKAEPAAAAPAAGEVVDAPEPTEILLWHAYRGDERTAIDSVIKKFNDAHTNLKIRALPIPFDALVDKLQVTIPRGQGPDIFIFAHNMIGQWLEAEAQPLIEPISTWVKPELLKTFVPESVRPLVYNKSLYGLPLAYKSVLLFYNKKLVPTPPKTTDELVAMAKAATNEAEKTYGLAYEAGNLYFHAPWIHGFGAVVLDDANAPKIDSAESIAACNFARGLFQTDKVVPEGMTSFMVASLFNDGKAAMVISGPWFRGDIGTDVDYAVAPMPTVTATGKQAAPMLGIEAVFLNANSQKKQWAFEAMRYLAGDASAIERAVTGKQPVPNVAAYEDTRLTSDAYLPVFADQAKQAIPMNASRNMQLVWTSYNNALSAAIFAPEGDCTAAMKGAQEKVLSDVERLRK